MGYTREEKQNYYDGRSVAIGDYSFCKSRQEAERDLLVRYRLKELCIKRRDKNGVSFQNGYIKYYEDKLKRK